MQVVMSALGKLQLDIAFSSGCADPRCKNPFCSEEMYINQQCHPQAPTQTKYNKSTGVVSVECAQCEREIVAIRVADN